MEPRAARRGSRRPRRLRRGRRGAIQTNTFGATAPRLARFGLADRLREIGTAAVRLAREAAPTVTIIGSLGPTGENVALGGKADVSALRDAFAEAAGALAAAGADAIHLETQFHPAELQAAIAGARDGARRRCR